MDASQYLRRLKESCTQTLGRPKAIDAGLRTQIVRNAATSTYIPPTQSKAQTGLRLTNECCLKPQAGYDGAVTPIAPPAGCVSQAACNDMENRYAEPITIQGCPIPYMSATYVQCDSYKYQGTREQTSEAERLRNCKDFTRPVLPPTQGCLVFNKGILRTPAANINGFNISSTDSFTVEWFQKLSPLTGFSSPSTHYYTIFSIGDFSNRTEAMTFYFKVSPPIPISTYEVFASQGNDFPAFHFGNFGSSPSDIRPISVIEDQWVHIALVGNAASPINTLTLYINGTQFGSAYSLYDFTTSNQQQFLTIGGTSPLNTDYYYNGCITNFRFTKGEALYTGTFTPPSAPLAVLPTTQTLLKTISDAPVNDASIPQKSITSIGPIRFSPDSPF